MDLALMLGSVFEVIGDMGTPDRLAIGSGFGYPASQACLHAAPFGDRDDGVPRHAGQDQVVVGVPAEDEASRVSPQAPTWAVATSPSTVIAMPRPAASPSAAASFAVISLSGV